jgi:hypothetical protein
LTVACTSIVTAVGAVTDALRMQFAAVPDPLQEPATFAFAVGMMAVRVPAVSRPVTTA